MGPGPPVKFYGTVSLLVSVRDPVWLQDLFQDRFLYSFTTGFSTVSTGVSDTDSIPVSSCESKTGNISEVSARGPLMPHEVPARGSRFFLTIVSVLA